MISPVDLQILAWMIERQDTDDLRAFNRVAFQKFGGVEGLLTRFLDRALAARVTLAQRQAAIKVMLALTDLDRQVRAGVLTIADLQTQLKGSLKPNDVTEAVTWLARGDVRLITPTERASESTTAPTSVLASESDGAMGYELAHERIIPALMRLAGKELTQADKANQLLDRRVNEWLGNQYSRRYLLSWGELWLIQRQKPYLVWGVKRRQKERLLQLSRRQVYWVLGIVALLAIPSVSYSSWLFYTDEGLMQRVRWELVRPLAKATDDKVIEAAVALVKDGHWRQAFGIVDNHIDNSKAIANFLGEAAEVFAKTDDSEGLRLAIRATDQISSDSYVLQTIVEVAGQLTEAQAVKKILSQAVSTAGEIENAYSKSMALRLIAEVYGQMGDSQAAKEVLSLAVSTTSEIEDTRVKSSALSAIAEVSGQMGDSQAAKEVLSLAVRVASQIGDTDYQSKALRAIFKVSGQLADFQATKEILNQALSAAGAIEDAECKSSTLQEIAKTTEQLGNAQAAKEILSQAVSTAGEIEDAYSKSSALSAIAEVYGHLGNALAAK
ncbi:MAG: hypothetical protein MJA27_30865, partial [Pseudanabaenales cyanobacterium]|nr:hypothetical protein [Pseudanabaenales cyanobacterium]